MKLFVAHFNSGSRNIAWMDRGKPLRLGVSVAAQSGVSHRKLFGRSFFFCESNSVAMKFGAYLETCRLRA